MRASPLQWKWHKPTTSASATDFSSPTGPGDSSPGPFFAGDGNGMRKPDWARCMHRALCFWECWFLGAVGRPGVWRGTCSVSDRAVSSPCAPAPVFWMLTALSSPTGPEGDPVDPSQLWGPLHMSFHTKREERNCPPCYIFDRARLAARVFPWRGRGPISWDEPVSNIRARLKYDR